MNLSNTDFVYHFQQLARITCLMRLPVSSVKNLEKQFVIPGRVCLPHLRASLLLMEETETVWEVREDFKIKDEQRIERPPAKACYEVYVPAIENYYGIFEPFHVRHFGNVGTVASQEKVTIMEGNWFQVPTFPTWGHLFFFGGRKRMPFVFYLEKYLERKASVSNSLNRKRRFQFVVEWLGVRQGLDN